MDPLSEWYQSSSPYAYVENDPISYFDPNGLFKTKFAARLYRFFNGGEGDIAYANDKKEYFVGRDVKSSDAVTYRRIFSGDMSKPSGGLVNAVDFFPSGIKFALGEYKRATKEIADNTDLYASFGIRKVTPKHLNLGVKVTAPIFKAEVSSLNKSKYSTIEGTYASKKIGKFYEGRVYAPTLEGITRTRHFFNLDKFYRLSLPKGMNIQADLKVNVGGRDVFRPVGIGIRGKYAKDISIWGRTYNIEAVVGARIQ